MAQKKKRCDAKRKLGPKLNSLQEHGKETSTDEASGDLDVGSSATGVGRSGAGTGAGGVSASGLIDHGTVAVGGAGTSGAARGSSASSLSTGCAVGGTIDDGGRVAGADDDLDSRVVADGDNDGVNARVLGGDGCASGKGGLEERDRGLERRLIGLGGGDWRSASDDAQGVGLLKVAGLRSRVDGGLVTVRL